MESKNTTKMENSEEYISLEDAKKLCLDLKTRFGEDSKITTPVLDLLETIETINLEKHLKSGVLESAIVKLNKLSETLSKLKLCRYGEYSLYGEYFDRLSPIITELEEKLERSHCAVSDDYEAIEFERGVEG